MIKTLFSHGTKARNPARVTALGALTALALVTGGAAYAEKITIGIGHQSTVTNTVPGGIILEKLELLEKHLPTTGKYADVDYEVIYRDYTSGPPITNQMVAGRLQFGVMGDYPLIVNGATFQQGGQDETRLIAITGYNLKGTGNGVVVPVASDVYSFDELKGKTISTPFGSASWGMVLSVLTERGMLDEVALANQSPPVGVNNIATGRIDAHADFTPWSEVMEFRGTGRKIFDGSASNIPTFHGTVVTKSFADEYPEIVSAYMDATLEAQEWVVADPLNAAIKVSEWTGIEKEVLYLYFSNGGISTFEASLKPEWVASLKKSHALLAKERDVPPLDFDRWVDPSFVRAAYEVKGMDYDVLVGSVVDTAVDNEGLPSEIWHPRDGISSYETLGQFFEAVAAIRDSGFKPAATYVYDESSGLKLFGNVAFYVKTGDDYAAFLNRADAESFAAESNGQILDYDSILDGISS
ncbi:ABC transporter substrate-binding protein [Rhodobacteraceae bacterium DSL-40]|uniref:ABC transporter substrate-binding protein n=1 Tax=Amaricoccus sp. B4 TaxID=3368557 RepID=UPI000DAB726A